jgi:hypothetical protein
MATSNAGLANLERRKSFQPGNDARRRSHAVTQALQLSRKWCPEAVMACVRVMNDPNEDTARRLKAAEIILLHGMPKGDTSKYFGEEQINTITINVVHHERPEPPKLEHLELTPITVTTMPTV